MTPVSAESQVQEVRSSPPNLQANLVFSPCFPHKRLTTTLLLFDVGHSSTYSIQTPVDLSETKQLWIAEGTLMKAAMLAVACKLLLHCLFTLEERSRGFGGNLNLQIYRRIKMR